MKRINLLLMLFAMTAILVSCGDDDDDVAPALPNAGTIAGGPFEFVVDGTPDMVSGITLDDTDAVGANSTWVITDDAGNILGLPPTLTDVEGVDFDGAGEGICFIWYMRYEDGLTGLEVGSNTSGLDGSFDLSNSIQVDRIALMLNAATLSGGPFTFIVDGEADNVIGIAIDESSATGTNSSFVITDDAGNILGLPPTLDAVEGVDFDGAGAGVCFIWNIRYEDDLTGLEAGMNTSGLSGTFALSNSIEVNRLGLNAGTLSGGPFAFTVDGVADMVSGITLDDADVVGTNTGYVITDDMGNILGLPPTLADVEGVNFDGAGVGVCFIWHISYEDNISGLEMGANTADLAGGFALSNSIEVSRNALVAGTLAGGPFTFTVDGTADMVSGITLDDTNNTGSNSTFVITDDMGNILGLPPTLTDVEGVNFDGAGVGVCFIWHATYEDGIVGLEAGMNTADLEGFFALSNSIEVNRVGLVAGTLTGGPFTFMVDGTPDMVSGITLDDSANTGSNSTFIITDDMGNILGLPATLADVEGVDFDGAGTGICFIWHATYEDGIIGLEAGMNTADLDGFFGLSNSIMVTRQ